jgi:DnaJ-class molecular chaperone
MKDLNPIGQFDGEVVAVHVEVHTACSRCDGSGETLYDFGIRCTPSETIKCFNCNGTGLIISNERITLKALKSLMGITGVL